VTFIIPRSNYSNIREEEEIEMDTGEKWNKRWMMIAILNI